MTESLQVLRLDTQDPDFDAQFNRYLEANVLHQPDMHVQVQEIVRQVREYGDSAVLSYTERFDRVSATSISELEISSRELKEAWQSITGRERELLRTVHSRIQQYHQAQLNRSFKLNAIQTLVEDKFGNKLGQREMPLDRVGVYVPGGTAAYPSTVLMTAVIATVAGVREIIVTVPTPDGERNPLVLAALFLTGADRVFAVGGAQAIAAMAYGTASVPQVDKIVGPGSIWVTLAKKLVVGDVDIDSIAGPSEIAVIADGTVPAAWVAADLLSQAEHDTLARAILLTDQPAYLDEVASFVESQLSKLPRRDITAQSLSTSGVFLLTESLEQAASLCNQIAPEHVEIATKDPNSILPLVKNAGAIFLGGYSSEVLGDYVAGPSHVLPTAGNARFASPLSVHDFLKRNSIIEITASGANELAPIARELAELEHLHAHALAASIRE